MGYKKDIPSPTYYNNESIAQLCSAKIPNMSGEQHQLFTNTCGHKAAIFMPPCAAVRTG